MNGRRFLVASILSVLNPSFVYPSCPHCLSKLSLRFRRYSCLKCGCTGDTREANYRYRLLLEVADTQDVSEVTVFGSCLDVYFGVTAKGLQRYIEELNREAGEPDSDAILGVVFQAVETCFSGKKFVFELKDSPKTDATSFLKNGYQANKYPKAFTACAMFLPDPGLLGCTVIYYIEQQRCSQFRQSLWSPDLVPSCDHPSRDFESLHSSGSLDVVPSVPIGAFSSFWPQSFGLSWCSVSSGATEHSLAFDLDKPESKDGSITSHSHLVYNLKDCILTVNKRNEQDKKAHTHSSQWSITVRDKLERHSSLGKKDANALQSPLTLGREESSNEICIQSSYGLANACNPPQRQEDHFASPSHATADAISLEVSRSLGELPASESIIDLLARLENNNVIVSTCNFPSNRINKFRDCFNQPDPKADTFRAGFMTKESDEKLQKLAKKVEFCKDDQLTLLASVNSKESDQEAYRSGKNQEWGCLSSQQSFILHLSFMADSKHSHSKGGCPSSKEVLDQNPNSYSSNSTASCLGNPPLCVKNANVKSNYKRSSNLSESGTKTSPCHPLSQTTGLPDIQEQGYFSGVHERSDKDDKEGELFPDEPVSRFLAVDCPENQFDASADLFDVSARGSTNAVWTSDVTLGCFPSDRMPGEADASWNGSRYRLSLYNGFEPSALKTSTPVAGSEIEPERSFRRTSLSVSLDRPCHQGSLSPEAKSILSKLPLDRLSWDSGKCKKSRLSFKSSFVKQLVSKFPSSARSSSANSATVSTCRPRRLHISDILARRLLPEGGIPSSEKMQVQDKRKRKSLLKHIGGCYSSGTSPLSGNKLRRVAAGEVSRLLKVGLTPKSQQPARESVGGHPICEERSSLWLLHMEPPGMSSCVSVSNSNPSLPLSPMPNVANWSGELFSGGSQLQSPEAIPSKSRPCAFVPLAQFQ